MGIPPPFIILQSSTCSEHLARAQVDMHVPVCVRACSRGFVRASFALCGVGCAGVCACECVCVSVMWGGAIHSQLPMSRAVKRAPGVQSRPFSILSPSSIACVWLGRGAHSFVQLRLEAFPSDLFGAPGPPTSFRYV